MKKFSLLILVASIATNLFAQNEPLQWQCRYAGAGDNSDKFNKIVAAGGGTYVAVGYTERNGNYKDFLTVKLDANLDTIWVRTKNGKNSGDDEAISCAVDASGNVYVTGYVDNGNTGDDFYTIKYDAFGTDLWDTAYNDVDSAFNNDHPTDCGIDPSGNFIVAGYTEQGTWTVNQDDYMILKYDSNGGLLWRRRYDRSGFKDDAAAMAIDAVGNVFVTGRSSNGTDDDYVTIKLDGATGNHLWIPVRIYSGGNGDDRATAIALDNAGNPVVTGRYRNSNGNDDYRTLKYSSAGVLQWNQAWFGAAQNDRATCIAIDQSTNDVYVAGGSDVNLSSSTDYDIVVVKYNASGIKQWYRSWGGAAQGDDWATDIAVDPFGNVIETGYTDADPTPGVSNNDWITIKYDAAGIQQYAKIQNGSRNDDDVANSLVIDAAGNAIAAGYLNNTTAQKDASRIQYDAIGNPTFIKNYNGEGDFNENSHAMVQDAAGNTYIAGYAFTESDNKNIFAGKIDASGNLVDTFMMNGSNDDDDELNAIANDGNGNIYACGYTKTSGEKSNFILMRFDANLDTLWTRQYDYINQSDKAVSMAADASGIYITGYSDADPNDTLANDDIVTIKYDANGNVLWLQRYDNLSHYRDEPVKLILGMNNTVYITGRTSNTHDDDIILLAYDRNTGNPATGFPQVWNNIFSDDDRATDLIQDVNGMVYVSGYSQSSSSVEDYTLLKYNSAGQLQWATGYDGLAGQEDRALALALDPSGNVVVAGETDVDFNTTVTNYNYGTFIYDGTGNWLCSGTAPFTYNGAGDGDDVPVAANVDGDHILVTGQSTEGTPVLHNKNIMVRIYSESACAELPEYAEYDGPAGGGDAPNATIVVSPAIFITGSSDGADLQKDIITLKFDINTGIKNVSNADATSFVYPNPFNNTATINFSNTLSSKNLSLKVYNVLGEVVYSKENVQSSIQLNKNNFADGVYSYKVFDSGSAVAGGRFVTN